MEQNHAMPAKQIGAVAYRLALPFTSVSTELRVVDVLLGPIPIRDK
jgi:hypothetical protein